jgi:ATP-binding cassette subfamily B protein
MEDRQAERFAGINDELTDKSTQAQNMTFLLLPVVTLTMNLSVVAILWFGGRMVISGGFPIGKIMAFINYLVQITFVLMNFTNFIVNISRAQASTARINEVLEVRPSITEPPEARLPANYDIEFRDVRFCYRKGGAMALEHLSFRVKEGETLGIIGATGSGKSSLASLIPRLYDVSSGQILIGGIDIRDLSLRELREKIGLVMQESLLFSGTIGGNLRFGDEYASDEEMNSASRDAQAYDFIEALPSGYDSPVEQRARNFSGGQKQRLSLARSLLQNPRILILDDSTSAVDLKTEAALRLALATRMRGRTMIVIAQRVSAVMDADQIIVLDFGRVAAAGGHEELLRSSEIYRNIAVSQLGTEVLNHV